MKPPAPGTAAPHPTLSPRERASGLGFETAAKAVDAAAAELAAAGIDSPRREARLLAARVLGVSAARILGWPETTLSADQQERLTELAHRRAAREPLAQLVGEREFWGRPFAVTADVLVPRPETETLIDAALEEFPDRFRQLSVLDLGTGSGCLLLSLLAEFPNASGIGVDASLAALRVAAANARTLGLKQRARFVAGDWAAALAHRFDLIVANPPYIPSGDIAGLAAEVSRYEPRLALDGGSDGLAEYRRIAGQLGDLLAPSGRAAFEVGRGQAPAVRRLLGSAGFPARIRHDLAGVERCLLVAPRENIETS